MDDRPYPDWWISQAQARRSELDASVARLKADVELLQSLDGILIFGSYARNQVGPESDLDLIAVEATDEPFGLRGLATRKRLLKTLGVAFDLIVYAPDEFERLSREWPFVMQARAEGIWISAKPPA